MCPIVIHSPIHILRKQTVLEELEKRRKFELETFKKVRYRVKLHFMLYVIISSDIKRSEL